MPQTMLGLLALVLASFVAFNQQRITQQSYRAALRDEIEIAASGTAQHVIEMLAARSFDEQSSPARVFQAGGVPTSAADFTAAGSFTADRGTLGCNLMDPSTTPLCDDIDDVNGLRSISVEARLSDGRTLPFTADINVVYVTSPGATTAATSPTLHKRVDLTLRTPLLPNLPNGIVTVSRVISYDPMKADADMEALCGAIGSLTSQCRVGGSVGAPG